MTAKNDFRRVVVVCDKIKMTVASKNLTVVIPFRNGHATIDRLLDSLPHELPVVVVDDLSKKPYQSHRNKVKVIRLARRGYFSGAVNHGIQECDTDVLVLNQDVWFEN